MRFAIYDMDRTITRTPSWMPWLLFVARTEAPWRLLLLPLAAVPLALYPLLGRKGLKQAMHALLIGPRLPAGRVAARAEAFAARFGPRAERAAALARIAADRAEGYEIVIATASSRVYAEALARRWGISHLVATENVWHHGALTPRIAGANCYGAAKAARVEAFLRERCGAAAPAHVRAYSDHASDAPLLALADEAIAVSPTPALRRLAAARGWSCVNWS